MELVHVEVDDIELVCLATHLVQHQHVVRDRVSHGLVESQGLGAAGNELRGGDGIAAGEQRHVVSLCDEFFSQVGSYPFGAAIETRRHTFHEGRNLGYLHVLCFPKSRRPEVGLVTECQPLGIARIVVRDFSRVLRSA